MTESEHSKLILEGPILISTTEIEGDDVMGHLKTKIVEAIGKGYLQNAESTRVLILSGTHGDEDGYSALTDILKSDEQFYKGDCERVGLKPVKQRMDFQKHSVTNHSIPDITKMEKLNLNIFQNCFLCDEKISKVTFQVTNIAYYHKKEEKLIYDIQKFDPKVLALAWCYSMKSDVSTALRKKGILARMVIEHDLREICKNPNAKLDDRQAEIIEKVANENPRNIILWGSSGTGKTILLTQALGIKASHFKRQNIEMRIIVSSFGCLETQPKKLMEDMESKYLPYFKLEKVEFIIFKDFCKGINNI